MADLVKNPQNRATVIRPLIERLGGKLHGFYYAFGDYDVVVISEAPDNVTMASVAMAAEASGPMKSFKTTVLMTPEEGMEAMRKAGRVGYNPQGS